MIDLNTKTLRRRLVLISVLQGLAVIMAAVLIAYVTHPTHVNHPDTSHPPAHVGVAPGPERPPPATPPRPVERRPFFALEGPQLTLLITMLILLWGGYLTAGAIVRPLERLSQTARRFGDGEWTVRSRLERRDEIGDVSRAFDEMAGRIEAMVSAERALLATLSHELRTPLARVRVALELLEDSEGDALDEISTDLGEVESLIDDILASARLRSGLAGALRLTTDVHPVDAQVLIERARVRFASRYPQRPLTVQIASTGRVAVHRMLVRRALENLLENAHKYTPDVSLPIELRLDCAAGMAVFEVCDLGQGLSAASQARAFEPFYRDARTADTAPGLGLGLALVQRIAQAHGGRIELLPGEPQGSVARLYVPLLVDPLVVDPLVVDPLVVDEPA